MEDPGIIAIRRVFSFLYEIYFELNCSACNSDNVTLTQVMLKNGLERSGESNVDENLIEWIPGLLGSGVCCVDQLTLWLIDIVNISLVWLFVSLVSGLVVDCSFCSLCSLCSLHWLPSFNVLSHMKCKNRLQLNISDVVSFAMNYAVIGLEREEGLFKSNPYPFIFTQHHEPIKLIKTFHKHGILHFQIVSSSRKTLTTTPRIATQNPSDSAANPNHRSNHRRNASPFPTPPFRNSFKTCCPNGSPSTSSTPISSWRSAASRRVV